MPGKIIRKETLNKHEQSMWDELQEYSEEFARYHGYNLDDAKKIGVRKFLKMEGWKGPEDVPKFKTDALHVSICPHCLEDFGIAEDIFGLCKKCKNEFNLKQMMDLTSLIGQAAMMEYTKDKGLSNEEKTILAEEAIKYMEFAFSRFIKDATLFSRAASNPDREISDGELLVNAAFKKDIDLVLRTENMDRINDLFVSIRHLVLEQLSKVYVFNDSQSTEV